MKKIYILQTSWDEGKSWHNVDYSELKTLEECKDHVKFQRERMCNTNPWRAYNYKESNYTTL